MNSEVDNNNEEKKHIEEETFLDFLTPERVKIIFSGLVGLTLGLGGGYYLGKRTHMKLRKT